MRQSVRTIACYLTRCGSWWPSSPRPTPKADAGNVQPVVEFAIDGEAGRGGKGTLGVWLVPTGDMKPSEETTRTYSCVKAGTLDTLCTSQYGGPMIFRVDGAEVSPCPVVLQVSSSLPFAMAQ